MFGENPPHLSWIFQTKCIHSNWRQARDPKPSTSVKKSLFQLLIRSDANGFMSTNKSKRIFPFKFLNKIDILLVKTKQKTVKRSVNNFVCNYLFALILSYRCCHLYNHFFIREILVTFLILISKFGSISKESYENHTFFLSIVEKN